jgi:flagellar basal-body rod modification protein FlgD
MNMAIQNVQATQNSNQNGAAKALADKTVTQDDFLRLLIVQLQNQDPLQPMDNQEFAAQLATFNSLSQLIEINDKLGAMQNGQGSMSQYNAAALIGKEISAAGNQISLSSGATANIGYQLGANAAKVVVGIFNSDGGLVRLIDGGARSAGAQSLLWDGRDATGKAVGPGVYGFEINAVDGNGRKIASAGKLQGLVSGVKLDGAEPVLEVNGVDVPLSGVIAIRAAR